MKELRREFVKAWKAWRKARAIRSAMAKLGYGRAGPVKAWYDECTVVMRRARRAVMMELQKRRTCKFCGKLAEPAYTTFNDSDARCERCSVSEFRWFGPTMYEWVDRGIQEGSAFMRIHADGRCELLNPDDVWREPSNEKR